MIEIASHDPSHGGKAEAMTESVPSSKALGVHLLVVLGVSVSVAALVGDAGFTPVGTFDGIVPVRPGRGNAGATASPRGQPQAITAFLEEVRALTKRP